MTSTDSILLMLPVNEFILTGGLLFRGQQTTAEALITWIYWWYLSGWKCFGISVDFWRWIPSIHSDLTSLLWFCVWKLQLLLKMPSRGIGSNIKGDIIPISSGQHSTVFFWHLATFMILLYFCHFRHGYEIFYGWELENNLKMEE